MGGTMSFDEALEHYKTHYNDWVPIGNKTRKEKDDKAMRTIFLEFAKTDYLGTKQFEAFEDAIRETEEGKKFFLARSLECHIIYINKKVLLETSYDILWVLNWVLNENPDKKPFQLDENNKFTDITVYIGSNKLNNKQVKNLLKFYEVLDQSKARSVSREIKYGFTQLKF